MEAKRIKFPSYKQVPKDFTGNCYIAQNRCHCWLFNGIYHRVDGPSILHEDGDEEWYFHGKRHRNGGPAFICENVRNWYKHGKLHRIDGPAIYDLENQKKYSFYINGVPFLEEQFWKYPEVIEVKMNQILTDL